MQASIENFLNSAGGAGSVVAHARLLIRLQNFYRKLAPSYLSESSTVARAGGTIAELAKTLPAGSLKSALEQLLERVEIKKDQA